MWRLPRISRLLLWTIVLAVLSAKASGAHVHLCLDGQEPPASVHVTDSHNDEHHDDAGQSDKDVNPLLGAFAKKGGPDDELDAPLALPLIVLSWNLPVVADGPFPPHIESPPAASPFRWRPPLRGPPV